MQFLTLQHFARREGSLTFFYSNLHPDAFKQIYLNMTVCAKNNEQSTLKHKGESRYRNKKKLFLI